MFSWPLFDEKRINRTPLVNELKVRVTTNKEIDGFVRREEIEREVRELMEEQGNIMGRERMRELNKVSMSALEEQGSSYKATNMVVSEWRIK